MPTVDTLVAQHLLKTVTALRLMGAECIISGIRPQIAQTIVHLGVDLQGVITKANLADALALALEAHRPYDHALSESMERIPILRMGEFLLVTIQVDMHDQLAMQLQDDLTAAIARIERRGVLIDISALEMVDSFIGRMIVGHLRHGDACSTAPPWSSACSRRWRSRWWSWDCRCLACRRRSMWSAAWHCCDRRPRDAMDVEAQEG